MFIFSNLNYRNTASLKVLPNCYNTKLVNSFLYIGIVLEAYAPLGSPKRFGISPDEPVVLEDTVVKQIASKHGATPAQVNAVSLLAQKFYFAVGVHCIFASIGFGCYTKVSD